MLRVHPFGFANCALSGHRVLPPNIAAGAHWAVTARAGINDDVLHRRTAVGERLVDRALELDCVAAAPAAIGGDHERRTRVFDAIFDGVGGKAAENHRVHGADAGAGLHGDHGLRNQGHVNDDAVAAPNAGRFECICKPAHLAVQLGIGELAHVARLTLEHDRDLLAPLAQIDIQTIVRHVQLSVGEPAEVGRLAVVQWHRKRPAPIDFGVRQIRPETDIVVRGLVVHPLQFAGLERGVLAELCGRRKYAVLLQHGLNVFLGHCLAPQLKLPA